MKKIHIYAGNIHGQGSRQVLQELKAEISASNRTDINVVEPIRRNRFYLIKHLFYTFFYFRNIHRIFVLPVSHEGRLHAVEGYPSKCENGLFLCLIL